MHQSHFHALFRIVDSNQRDWSTEALDDIVEAESIKSGLS